MESSDDEGGGGTGSSSALAKAGGGGSSSALKTAAGAWRVRRSLRCSSASLAVPLYWVPRA